jgi:hypothetical protein
MKVGDLVKTKIPGFGTGQESHIGVVIEESLRREFKILESGGFMRTWYSWQLELVNESR